MTDSNFYQTPIVVSGDPSEAELFARRLSRIETALDHTVDKLQVDRLRDAEDGLSAAALAYRLDRHVRVSEKLTRQIRRLKRATTEFVNTLRELQASTVALNEERRSLWERRAVPFGPNALVFSDMQDFEERVQRMRAREHRAHANFQTALADFPALQEFSTSLPAYYGPYHS